MVATLLAVTLGLLQWILARWRDLGPLTLTAAGVAVLLAIPDPSAAVLVGVTSAVLSASAGWARGAARGVGRPALDGLVLAGIVAAGAVLAAVPAWVPPVMVRPPVTGALLLLGLVAATLALERPSGGRPPTRWVGEVRVG